MKKIILISDESWYGGASITNQAIIDEGKELGYEIDMYAYGQTEYLNEREFKVPNADFYILANYGYIPKHDLIQFCTKNKGKYVRFFHDIPGFVSALPSSFHAENELVLQLILDNAVHIFMISPMQHDVVTRRLKLDDEKISIIPPYIPLDSFEDFKKERLKDSWLYLGDISEARGIVKSIQIAINNKGKHFILAGPEVREGFVNDLKKHFNEKIEIDYLGQIKYEKVNELMNRYENFIYTPEMYDSFCRKVVEAQKAGMKVHVDNRRIGVYSYPKDYDIEEGVKTANKILWKTITAQIKE